MSRVLSPDTIAARRKRAEAALASADAIVLIAAGDPIGIPGGLDQTYAYRPHPLYYWLTGSRRSGGVLAFEPNHGWTHFVRPVTADERLWEGEATAPPGEDVAKLRDWLAQRGKRQVATPALGLSGVRSDPKRTAELAERLDAARRPKDAAEMELIARAAAATAAGFARARAVIRPGVTERAIQIELEAEMYRHGADGVGYDTIVGAGARAAALHTQPGETVAGEKDVVLIDAGGSLLGYTADVTRTFPAGERFTPEQQAIFDLVRAAERAAIARCQAGVEWHEIHRTAATVMAEGLVGLGILRGEVDGLLEGGAIALFFPHGIGHMVGLGVRDVGGRAPGRPAGRLCCGARVRVDLPLEEGFLMTVEPGLYFVPAILDDPERREKYRSAVAWDALDRWRPVGGVRTEDDVLITANGPQIVTEAIPH